MFAYIHMYFIAVVVVAVGFVARLPCILEFYFLCCRCLCFSYVLGIRSKVGQVFYGNKFRNCFYITHFLSLLQRIAKQQQPQQQQQQWLIGLAEKTLEYPEIKR